MGKKIVVHSLPDRKNDFRIWVDKIRSSKINQDQTVIKTVYIHKSGKNSGDNSRNWSSIQSNSRIKYLKKIQMMEEIRLRKIESKTINFIYTPRYVYPTVSGSK